MAIEWNRVTWYSQAAAFVVMGAVMMLGFYFGMEYQKAFYEAKPTQDFSRTVPLGTPQPLMPPPVR